MPSTTTMRRFSAVLALAMSGGFVASTHEASQCESSATAAATRAKFAVQSQPSSLQLLQKGTLVGRKEGTAAFLEAEDAAGTQPAVSTAGPSAPVACCMAMTANCLACTAGRSVESFCMDPAHKNVTGCALSPPPPPRGIFCCMAQTSKCLACQRRVSERDFCALPENQDVEGCTRVVHGDTDDGHRVCCLAKTAECLACEAGQRVADFCADLVHAAVAGCKPSPADSALPVQAKPLEAA